MGRSTTCEADLDVIRALQPALEAGDYAVTVAVHDGRDDHRASGRASTTGRYGVAIDIGSTTIAGHLADLADGEVLASDGVMNPQIRFGEDLMSRVSYAMMHPEGGAAEMTERGARARSTGLRRRASRRGAGVDARRDPRAHARRQPDHASPRCSASTRCRSGSAPFALATDAAVRMRRRELGLPAHPGARVYVLPCIAGHVGADTRA